MVDDIDMQIRMSKQISQHYVTEKYDVWENL